MGAYGPKGADWLSLDMATDTTRRQHPTGQGTKRAIGLQVTSASPAAYTVSNRRITLAGAFSGYARTAGDIWIPTGGTGFNAPSFTIASNTVNLIVLTAGQPGLPAADNTDSTGFIVPVGSILGRNGSARLHGILVTTIDAVDSTIDLRTLDTGALVQSISIAATLAAPLYIPLGSRYGGGLYVPHGFTVNGTSGTTLAFNVYFERVD